MSSSPLPWYRLLSRYHWFVLIVAALGWLFDCLDQQLFILARPAAMKDLVTEVVGMDGASADEIAKELEIQRRSAGDFATSLFIAGWATGGLFFGVLGDRIGRARTMVITILMYSLFTGLSAISQSTFDFAIYRFLTGLGVGGEFAVGVALVAEVMPDAARPYALGLLQALSAVGNISAARINLGLCVAEEQGLVTSPWRIMFMVGAVPALLALVIRSRLKEPETWQKASLVNSTQKQLGSYRELFRDRKLRKHALLGLVLGCSGIIGLWSIVFYTPDLVRSVQRKNTTIEVYTAELRQAESDGNTDRADHIRQLLLFVDDPRLVLAPDSLAVQASLAGSINGRLARWASYASIAVNIGGAMGMFGFGPLSQRIGRKPTFTIAFLAAMLVTALVFWTLRDFWQIWIMVPVMGFFQMSIFAGYAIYFPELFPTHLRSTGTSFCYNVGRFVAAFGPIIKSSLESQFAHTDEPIRYAAMAMTTVFLLGVVVLPFLPETKGQPLPE
ncbi:MAG: MFS transporter [Planctomycetota bacterium]|nr:MFS transporter [Planctomycetota bacterium]